ncbi:hypothetical protein FA95DRAFT_1611284 [Auriscalpium vulgare]|uniref:Uncharacterized protein n=1 Tax=Auriscalpium vulgare TaxID=40419 RepID=A0ACB8RB65_9AGAM|nr:hypothetical protein FA95DRAFT_1611284 [Auriscalpium vulgare]
MPEKAWAYYSSASDDEITNRMTVQYAGQLRLGMGSGNVERVLEEACRGVNASLVIVILPNFAAPQRKTVKARGDSKRRVATQCLKLEKLDQANDQYYNNVALKYAAFARVQQPRAEMRLDLKEMTEAALDNFYKKNNNLPPKRLVFFRDGISEGEFETVARPSRPGHYIVLSNNNNYDAKQLQALSHHLCYVYARATRRSVSTPAPVYYAQLWAGFYGQKDGLLLPLLEHLFIPCSNY